MSAALSGVVDLIHPTVSGVGISIGDNIWIVFNREMDETTIAGGNFFLTGPDFDTMMGPDLLLFHDTASIGTEEKILQSPGFEGIVQGSITFDRLALDSLTVVSGIDTVGSGLLYRTRATLTPSTKLSPDTTYTVYLSGDEDTSDSLKTGISSRTVFDTVSSGINTSTGTVAFNGGYLGTYSDVYHVEITTSGDVETARFEYWRDSIPSSTHGPFRTKRSSVLLEDGVSVSFTDGIYQVGDHWHVVVKPRDSFSSNFKWPFSTGSGSFSDIPEDTSTTVVGDIPATVSTTVSGTTFKVLSTLPADQTTNRKLPTGDFDIKVEFDSPPKESTLTSGDNLIVYSEPANGDPEIFEPSELPFSTRTAGQTLFITIPSGYLQENQLVTTTLSSRTTNTSGVTLGSDYTFWFTTKYNPLYCSIRKIRLDIGVYIQDVLDDTINLAIFEASLAADQLTWNKENLGDSYYKHARMQWTCCKAEEILLLNALGQGTGNLSSKKLGDLQVDYDTANSPLKTALDRAVQCLNRWEMVIRAGGRQIQKAQYVVKGEWDPDRPPVGRGWTTMPGTPPVGNRFVTPTGGRRALKVYSTRPLPPWGKGWGNK